MCSINHILNAILLERTKSLKHIITLSKAKYFVYNKASPMPL